MCPTRFNDHKSQLVITRIVSSHPHVDERRALNYGYEILNMGMWEP